MSLCDRDILTCQAVDGALYLRLLGFVLNELIELLSVCGGEILQTIGGLWADAELIHGSQGDWLSAWKGLMSDGSCSN